MTTKLSDIEANKAVAYFMRRRRISRTEGAFHTPKAYIIWAVKSFFTAHIDMHQYATKLILTILKKQSIIRGSFVNTNIKIVF